MLFIINKIRHSSRSSSIQRSKTTADLRCLVMLNNFEKFRKKEKRKKKKKKKEKRKEKERNQKRKQKIKEKKTEEKNRHTKRIEDRHT